MLSIPIIHYSIPVSAESTASSLQQQLEELEKKNKEYQKILEKTKSDIKEKEEYTEALVNKIDILDNKIAVIHQTIVELNNNINEKQTELDKANDEMQQEIDTLCTRLRTIYMAGNATDLEIILGAKDFSDFIDKVQLLRTLSNYDKKLIDSIKVKLAEITEQKESLEKDRSRVQEQEDELKEDEEELNKLVEENEKVLSALYKASDAAQKKIDNAELKSEEIEKQIIEYYQKLAESVSLSNGNINPDDIAKSGFTWPCPGFYYLSSLWNENRVTYNHGAIDIAGAGIMGKAVVAADDGTVIGAFNGCKHNWGKSASCGCGGGYGNYVMIEHGNGKMTVYGHFTIGVVEIGDTVKKGQTIGFVGSTGNSTGPHLHFECRLNGVKYNPMIEYENIDTTN